MADYNAELDRFLNTSSAPGSSAPDAAAQPVKPAETTQARDYNAELDRLLGEQPTQVTPMPAAPAADFTSGLDAFLAQPSNDQLPAGGGYPPPTSTPAVPDQMVAGEDQAAAAKPGFVDSLTGGFKRGVAQVAATPYDLAGIAAEATGNEEAAQSAFESARRIEAFAGESAYTWDDVNGAETFANWLAEKFGEQAPVFATLFTGAGAGGLAARLAGKGLLRSASSRALAARIGQGVGGAGAGVGLETAGTGSELRQATGSYQPDTAVAAGAVKGVLEWYGPAKMLKALETPGATVVKEGVKSFFREGLTEGAQEIVDATARAFEDEKYDFWSRDTYKRVRESTLAGAFVGGGVGAGVHALGKGMGAGEEKPGTQRDVDPSTVQPEEEAPAPDYQDEGTWFNPLVWLRRKFGKKSSIGPDSALEPTDDPVVDYSEQGTMFAGVRRTWELAGVNQEQVDSILDFEDAVKPRFFLLDKSGKALTARALTDTDAELELSLLPQGERPNIIQADLTQMNAGSLTAEEFDLPESGNDARIFFVPKVPKAQQAALRAQYEATVGQYTRDAQTGSLVDAEARAMSRKVIEGMYAPLVSAGLRVIPSRGSSFIYKGEVKGPSIYDISSTGRMTVTGPADRKFKAGQTLNRVKSDISWLGQSATEEQDRVPITLDYNKLKWEDGFSILYSNVDMKFDRPKGQGSSRMWMIYRDPNIDETQKDLLAMQLGRAQTVDQFRAAWEAGVMYDPRKADIDSFVVTRDVDHSKKTPAAQKPGQDLTDLSVRNNQNVTESVTSVDPKLDEQIRYAEATSRPELAQIMRAVLDAAKELAPSIHALGERMGMRPFQIKIVASQPGIAMWNGNNREIAVGVYSLAAQVHEGLTSTNDVKLLTWRTMLHEFGHGLTFDHYVGLPAEWRLSLRTAYERARLYERMTGDWSKTNPAVPGSTDQMSPNSYYLKFTEWLTEQFVRWSISEAVPRNENEVFFRKMGQAFKKYGEEFVDLVGVDRARNIMEPSWQFAKAMEYLEKANQGILKPQLQVDEIRGLVEIPAYDTTMKELEAFRQLIPKDVQLEIHQGESPISAIPAAYYTGPRIIRLWLGSLQIHGFDPKEAIAHEAGHACWNLFTPQEQAVLVEAAGEANLMSGALRQVYHDYYKDQGATPEQIKQLIDEESVMFMLQARAKGQVFQPKVNALLDALLKFLARIKEMLAGQGLRTADDLINAFYSGEIASRDRDMMLQGAIRKARLATDGREKWINPSKVEQVEGDLYLATEYFPEGAMHRYYKAPAVGTILTGDAKTDLMLLGEEVGYMSLTYYGEAKGYDVDMVQVHDKFNVRSPRQLKELGGESYVQKFTRYGEKELGRPFKASGIMTQAGYRSRQRFAPLELRWHVFDEISKMWYSPNYINHQINEWQYELDKIKQGQKSLYDRVAVQGQISKWIRMKGKVDPKAWADPDLPNQFSTDPSTWARVAEAEAKLGLNEIEGKLDENKYIEMMTGQEIGPTQSVFDQVDAREQAQSKAQNAKSLKLDDPQLAAERQPETKILEAIMRRGEDSPTVGPILSGRRTNIAGEADRISKFSKLLMGIQQIAWRNQHLRPMQIFVSLINQMQALRMRWIARADETARAWDRNMNEADRTGLTDMLFWATEMEYLSQQERAAGTVRQPTVAELQNFITRNRLGPEVMNMYQRVQGDFDAFLAEVERVSTKNLQRQFLTGPNPNQAAYQAAINELQADMRSMRARPYFPMVRFGQWTVTIRDPGLNDQVIFFSAYATQAERDAAVRQMAGNHVGHRIQVGRVTEDLHEFMGLPAPLLRAIKNMPGISQTQQDWIDQFLHQASPERSFRKRWLQRKGTPGYSRDGIRAYSHYFLSGANYLAKLDFKEELQDQIQMLRQTLPTLADTKKRSLIIEAMQSAHKYIMEGGRDWAKFKSFVSLWQLGFNPAAAAMNLLQSPTVTLPYFSGIYGRGANVLMSQCANGLKRAGLSFRPSTSSTQFDAARLMLQQMGKIDVGQAPELGSYAEGYNLLNLSAGTRAQRAWRQLSHMGMAMFAVAERINREIAFGMSWQYSTSQPNHPHLQQIEVTYITEINALQGQTIEVNGQQVTISRDTAIAIVAAREAIDRTQFVYAPWARPGFLRNPLASSFLVFFQYTQAMIYAFGNNPGRVKMFLIYASLFGLMGLPGADDLDEVLNAIAKRIFGKEFSLEAEARKFVRELTQGTIFDEVGPDLLAHGLSRYSFGPGLMQEGYGIPQFDASANGSLGQVVPGLAQAASAIGNRKDWKDITAEVARDTAGAGFGQMFSLLQFLQSDPFTSDIKKWEAVMPRGVRALSKASRYYLEERERTKQGGTLVDFDVQDPDDLATIALQAFGFSPTRINQKWDAIGKVNDTYQYFYGRKSALMAQYNEALIWKDKEAVATVRGRILDYNREVRERGLSGMSISSDGLKQSMRARATSRALQDQGLPAQKSQIQIQRQVGKEMYPGVFEQKVK